MLRRAVEACGVFESVDLYQKGFRLDKFIDCIDLASQCKSDAFRLTCCSFKWPRLSAAGTGKRLASASRYFRVWF